MLYASLTGPLLGIYYPVPTIDENEARLMMNSSKLSKLWCSIYTLTEVQDQIAEHGGVILPEDMRQQLDYDYYVVKEGMKNATT